MKRIAICLLLTAVMSFAAGTKEHAGVSVDFGHGKLMVSDNHRYLIHADGTPFFYLGDTAWELFNRLDREEASRYLENRRAKGFTVIQAAVLAALDGLNTPNSYGDRPLIDNNPNRPNEAYFKHVDAIVEMARGKGIYMGLLPTWGDKVTKAYDSKGPIVFNETNAEQYGRFLGQRYKDYPNIIWILGGDRAADKVEPVWRAMVRGIKAGGDEHLMTYHPQGRRTSADWFHNDAWLDFNMLQSGHREVDMDNYRMIDMDYRRSPVKPCLDGEPRYENLPVKWRSEQWWFNDFDVRQAAYWGLFAGAFGHTYGCHDIWQMKSPKWPAEIGARGIWNESMDLPGAGQMLHVRRLMESRPVLERVPDQSIIKASQQEDGRHLQATRGGDYLMVYTPYGDTVQVDDGTISGTKRKVWWYNPRDGGAELIGEFGRGEKLQFDPPGESQRGNDWVLVMDDADKKYGPPGAAK
ncbi:MAG: glycoside hydrolase family 140 protein [Sedimentisphaerales bacterium]|nr:glycoside hydrolase family 140 protein [Sedimentisphaerales bacterium]